MKTIKKYDNDDSSTGSETEPNCVSEPALAYGATGCEVRGARCEGDDATELDDDFVLSPEQIAILDERLAETEKYGTEGWITHEELMLKMRQKSAELKLQRKTMYATVQNQI